MELKETLDFQTFNMLWSVQCNLCNTIPVGSLISRNFGHITVGTHIYKLSNEEWDEQSKLKLATTCFFTGAIYIVSNGWWQMTLISTMSKQVLLVALKPSGPCVGQKIETFNLQIFFSPRCRAKSY